MEMSFNSIKLENPSNHVMPSVATSHTINTSVSNVKLEPVLAKKSNPALNTEHLSPNASNNGSTSSPELLRCKRRINFGGLGYALPQTQPATVARRNERERNRVKMVNMGFHTLRQHVPNGAKNKKMSKVETLRSAVEYIRELRQLLGDNEDFNISEPHCSDSLQMQSMSSDENWNPGSSTMSSSGTLPSPSAISYTCNSTPVNTSMGMRKIPNSPSSPILATSPSPSMGSDASSPYDSLDSMERQVSPEEEVLFDFNTWFS